MMWAIWLGRNDIAFDKKSVPSYMQVIYRGYILDESMCIVSKGGGTQTTA
jgi:hypothetical protein